ncbi:PREDICTED: uncharacterized protein LOC108355417, partial [Rhagoletis zephyria]|uniref:uncharacterized protein LOC108355417 n=1 Tax=Rhagoletis zephyria TaxID=28612 RepID=UPI00081196B8
MIAIRYLSLTRLRIAPLNYFSARNAENLNKTGNVELDSVEWLNTSNPQVLYGSGVVENSAPDEQEVGEPEPLKAESEIVDALSVAHAKCDVLEYDPDMLEGETDMLEGDSNALHGGTDVIHGDADVLQGDRDVLHGDALEYMAGNATFT